jgi:ADP-ribose pyrophosphatase YjhB (NUDIX family)
MSPANLMKFCSTCGHPVEFRVPPGDHLPRHVCGHCGAIHYHNPRIIAGCVPEAADGRILMCRRAIEPRLGFWTFPAGFLELSESSAQGAARETLEESQAEVEVDDLFAVIAVPYVSQIYMLHRGRMKNVHHGVTPESSETQLMREDEIPWQEIAFATIYHGLKFFFEDRARGVKGFHEMNLTIRPPLKEHGALSKA